MSEERYWIVEKMDSAILGYTSGQQRKQSVAGPFDSYEEAMEAKRAYRRFGATYYTIEESPTEPESSSKEYEFVDAAREFDDVGGW